MRNLQDYRQEINEIDDRIIELLNERFQVSVEIGEYKRERALPTLDRDREEEIKAKILQIKAAEVIKERILGVYAAIFKESRELQ